LVRPIRSNAPGACRLSVVVLRFVCTSAFILLLLAATGACAQKPAPVFDASNLSEPADLGAPWLIHTGDDLAYARPDFDDSHWTSFDPHRSLTVYFPKTQPEVVWYRLRVKVNPAQTGLALREWNISHAFEVYLNGERLLGNGQVAPFVSYTSSAIVLKRIPDRMVATGTLLIAIRAHISPVEWVSGQDPGYYANNLTIGQEHTLYEENWLGAIGQNALGWLDELTGMALGVVALVLYWAQRRQKEYLWIAAIGLLALAQMPIQILSVFSNIPTPWELEIDFCWLFTPFVLTSLYFAFVGQRIGWRWRAFLIFAGVTYGYSGMAGLFVAASGPLQLAANLPFIVLLCVIIPVVLTVHFWRGHREAGILLIPVLLLSLYVYAKVVFGAMFQMPGGRDMALRGMNLIDRFPAGPFSLSLNGISSILSTLSLAIIMMLRSLKMSRRQAQIEGELAAAKQVQEVLLPEEMETVPGFTVETAYQPAQQVGGDFFQVLPAGNGGLLLVVGDVAGKGLPAAMLVSVLVGAIRATADHTHCPDEVLASLNERLLGRVSGSFATALAAYIAADGRVTLANAGHLSPYLDGREIDLPGALPLGILSHVQYALTQVYLAPGSRLTFYSDGVVEAQNQSRELLGFDRARELSTQPATEIVEAAKQFGQSDDITVVTIERAAAIATAA
jgi:hypothetical protein